MNLLIFEKDKCLACLYEVTDLKIKLADLRVKIKTEIGELVPESFHFLYQDIPLTPKQELTLKVAQCVINDDNYSDETSTSCKLYIKKDKTHEQELQRTPSGSTNQKSPVEVSNFDLHASATASTNLPLLFTEEELSNQSCWLEQARQQHWNYKVQQLRHSRHVQMYTKSEYIGIIDTDWTFRKAEILKLKASELKVTEERIRTLHGERLASCLRKTSCDSLTPSQNIQKNLESVSKFLFLVRSEDKKLQITSGVKVEKAEQVQIEERLHQYLSGLKRGCDSLFKALEAQRLKFETFMAECSKVGELDESEHGLTREEEEDIVAQFRLIES